MRTSLSLRSILGAQKNIQAFLKPTPLIQSTTLSDLLQGEVWLKLENLQPTGSFKVRGAIHKLHMLSSEPGLKGVVTGSAGNHGLGVAYAARLMGIAPVTVVVPENAPAPKRAKLRSFDVTLVEVGQTYEEAHRAAKGMSDDEGWTYIEAYDDADVIAGQGTVGLELMQQLPEMDVVVVPVGGGGLIAGIANAVKGLNPLCDVVGVQAQASPAAWMSLRDGKPYDPYDHEPTIADGLAGGFGKLPFYLSRLLIDRIELASEAQLREAVYLLLKHELMVAEPSAAISIHPIVKGTADWRDRKIVCVISGGNLSLSLLHDIMSEHDE